MNSTFIFILAWALFVPIPRQAFAAGTPDVSAVLTVEDLGAEPEVEMQTPRDSTRVLYLRTRGGTTYLLPDEPNTPSNQAIFERMSGDDQDRFRAARLGYLRRALWVLHLARYPAGAGSSIKAKICGLVRSLFASDSEVAASPGMGEKGRRAIQEMLRSVDNLLWASAPVLAHPNEAGITFIVSKGGGLMVDRLGLGGYNDFMLSFTLNRRDRAVAVELVQDLERMRRALPLFAGVGIFFGVLITVNNYDWNRASLTERAETLSGPWVLAGSASATSLRVGGGWGPSLHIPVVGDLNVAQGEAFRITWFRVGLSPRFLGLVKVGGLLGAVVNAPLNAVKVVGRTCARLLGSFTPPEHSDPRWYGG